MLGLTRTDGACLSSPKVWSLSLPKCSNSSWCSTPLITKAWCNVDLCSQRRAPGQGRSPCCFLPLVGKTLGPDWSGSVTSPFSVIHSFSPHGSGLFCSPQVFFRVTCICCSCFPGMCEKGEERGFFLASLLCHLFFPFSPSWHFKQMNFSLGSKIEIVSNSKKKKRKNQKFKIFCVIFQCFLIPGN